jgi:hypothetical protein
MVRSILESITVDNAIAEAMNHRPLAALLKLLAALDEEEPNLALCGSLVDSIQSEDFTAEFQDFQNSQHLTNARNKFRRTTMLYCNVSAEAAGRAAEAAGRALAEERANNEAAGRAAEAAARIDAEKKYQSALRNQKHMIITSVSKVALSAILPTDSSIRTVEDFVRASSLNCSDFPSYDDFCALGRDFLNHRFDTFLSETESRVQKELHDIFERHSKLVSSRRPVAAGAAVASAAAAAAAAVSALSATGGENVIFDLSSTAIRGDVEKPDFVAVPADYFERFHTADDKSVAWAGVSCVLELKQDTLPRSGDGYDNARGQLLQRMFMMTSDPSFGAIFSPGAALLLGWKKWDDTVRPWELYMPAVQWNANGLTPFAACVALMSVPRAGLGHKCSPAEELAVTFLQPCIQGETLPEPLGFTSTLTATLAVPRVKQSHIFLRRDGTAVIKLYQDEGFCMHEYEVLDYLHSRNTPTLDISSRVPRAVKVGNSPLLLSISPAGSTDLQRYGRRDCTAQGLGRLRTVL